MSTLSGPDNRSPISLEGGLDYLARQIRSMSLSMQEVSHELLARWHISNLSLNEVAADMLKAEIVDEQGINFILDKLNTRELLDDISVEAQQATLKQFAKNIYGKREFIETKNLVPEEFRVGDLIGLNTGDAYLVDLSEDYSGVKLRLISIKETKGGRKKTRRTLAKERCSVDMVNTSNFNFHRRHTIPSLMRLLDKDDMFFLHKTLFGMHNIKDQDPKFLRPGVLDFTSAAKIAGGCWRCFWL